MEPTTVTWQPAGKFFFRFFFLFLGASTIICWDNIGDMIHRTFSTAQFNFDALYGFLHGPVHWLDVHLFHTGYDPKTQQPFPGDNHFGILFYLLLLLVAGIGAIAWSILDRKRQDYNSAYTPRPYAVVNYMQDDQDFFFFEIDSTKRTFTLKDPDDSLHPHVFSYSNPAPRGAGGRSQMLLTGDWRGRNVQILMNDIPIDSMRLVKEPIRLIRD